MSSVELPALMVRGVELVATTTRPLLLNRDPAPDETGVPVDGAVAFEVIDTGRDGIDASATEVWIDGVLALDTGAVTPAFTGSVAAIDDGYRVVLQPRAPFASQATVTVQVEAQTRGVPARLEASYAFTVEDRTAPRVVAAQARSARTVRVAFDEPIALPAGATFSITPRGAPAVPVDVSGATVDGTVALLALDTELTPDVPYEVVSAGVTDLAGNAVMGPYDRVTFAGFRPARPQGRRFDLWRMLPKHNRADDKTGDLARFIGCLQEVTDLLLADLDRWPDLFDLERAPATFVDLILQDLGNPFPFELDLLSKRRLASVLVEMYRQKGTAKGIRNAIRFFLGIEVSGITPLNVDTLVLGESELGVAWTLGPSDRFARYAFNVEVARVLTETERRRLRAIVEYLKPAHTHFVELVEPRSAARADDWELGYSELGDSTALH